MTEELRHTEVLLIGCGMAGGTAALQLADAGLSVCVLTRALDPLDSNTGHAQGGIIYRGREDSSALLTEDIQRAGAGISHPPAALLLAQQGPGLVESFLMERLGIAFDTTAAGRLFLAQEGGHTVPRIVHTHDATGRTIATALLHALENHPNVQLLTGHTAVDLLTTTHQARGRLVHAYRSPVCVGAYVLDRKTGHIKRFMAKAILLATGGVGRLFLWTTNPEGARGDGLAMALRAGARTIHNEFLQFHPTTLYHPRAPGYLISEAVRGAGARLLNDKGEAFMARYDPEWRDLAPRDIVARAIHQEMLSTGAPCVWLDVASALSSAAIRQMFPTIYQRCIALGIDITAQPIPVVPAAHYHCGGVWVDDHGQTTLQGLFAAGEVACTGLHGANRLASTSLLEGLVWGHRAAQRMGEYLGEQAAPFPASEIPSWEESGQYPVDEALIAQDMSVIQHILWNYVGLVRTTPRLERAMRDLSNLESEIERFYRKGIMSDALVGLRNAVAAARAMATAAWENKTSIGCHFRL